MENTYQTSKPNIKGLKMLGYVPQKEIGVIYTLVDPRDNKPKYIGMTINPESRYDQHVFSEYNRTNSKKNTWIRKLKKLNLFPIMQIVCLVPKEEVDKCESEYIKEYRNLYPDLKNMNDGLMFTYKTGLHKVIRPVYVYSLVNNTFSYFESSKLADVFCGAKVTDVLCNKELTVKDHICARTKEELIQKIEAYKNHINPMSTPIYGIDKDGNTVQFKSLNEASFAGFDKRVIKKYIKLNKIYKNYNWFYGRKNVGNN